MCLSCVRHRVSDSDNPTVNELVSVMEGFNREQFDPLYERYQTPLIFLTPFQSRDHAAKQEWFEPMANADNVGLDLEAQKDLYDAFFQSTADEE